MNKLIAVLVGLVCLISPTASNGADDVLTADKVEPLIGKWQHSGSAQASFEISAIDIETGNVKIRYVGRSGREVPMKGKVALTGGKLQLTLEGGIQQFIKWTLWYQGNGLLDGTFRSAQFDGEQRVSVTRVK
jgi:hypothetical protein